ncbi:hypothetical protein MXD59_06900 [Frankia sp. Ag45/Mut15]|uniref:Lipoprotein n=1 Tax=Frankia umida TaxID=573489 RepID=A0ABT0JVC5_9ACTN|nr:hypothetical protein [Frankia umida]MCK9875503.1 hypothetical protein [Frankia umida]
MRNSRTALLLACLLLGGAAACSSSDAPGPTPNSSPRSSPESTPGGVLGVAEARRASAGTVVSVRGYVLLEPDGTSRLCTGLAGSYPPQCGEPALRLVGTDPTRLENPSHASGVTWTGETVLIGTVQDGVLTVQR